MPQGTKDQIPVSFMYMQYTQYVYHLLKHFLGVTVGEIRLPKVCVCVCVTIIRKEKNGVNLRIQVSETHSFFQFDCEFAFER